MAANLKDIARRVFRRANWDPNPNEEAVQDCYAFINDAVQQLALDCPIALFEERLTIQTDPDAPSYDETDTITLVTEESDAFNGAVNPWVFQVDIPVLIDGVVNTDPHTSWVVGQSTTSRQWAGRKIDIILSNGTVVRNQIRSVWVEDVLENDVTNTHARLSVVTPWLDEVFGSGPFTYRVYTDDNWLPDDIIEINSARIIGSNLTKPLEVVGQAEAEDAGYANERSEDIGPPRVMFRGQRFSLQAPNVAPDADTTATMAYPWRGPEPPGEFEYCFTYCWGRRRDYNPGIARWDMEAKEWREPDSTSIPDDDRMSVIRKREPLWESSPSPIVSATVTAPTDNNPGGGVLLTLPNIEYMLGFMLSGLTSQGALDTDFRRVSTAHSGFHIRIYRRRKTADFTNYDHLGQYIGATGDWTSSQSVQTLHKIDIPDAFFLLYEIRLDEYNEGRWLDDGRILPDYSRRLRSQNNYQAVRFWPRPDDSYEVELRCVRRPQELVSPQDAPPVSAEAIMMVVDHAAAMLYERMGEQGLAMARMADYQRNLDTYRRRYGDLRPDNTPIRKQFARARGYNRLAPWRRPRGLE